MNSNFQELADRIALLEASLASAQAREPVSFHYTGPVNADILTNGSRRLVITDIVFDGGGTQLSSTTRGRLIDAPISFGNIGDRSTRDYRMSFKMGIVIEPDEVIQIINLNPQQVSIMLSGYYFPE